MFLLFQFSHSKFELVSETSNTFILSFTFLHQHYFDVIVIFDQWSYRFLMQFDFGFKGQILFFKICQIYIFLLEVGELGTYLFDFVIFGVILFLKALAFQF